MSIKLAEVVEDTKSTHGQAYKSNFIEFNNKNNNNVTLSEVDFCILSSPT